MKFKRYRDRVPFTRRQLTPVWLVIGTIVLLLLCGCSGLFLYAIGQSGSDHEDASPSTAASSTPASSVSGAPLAAAPVPAAGRLTVPGVVNVRLSDAKAQIKAAGFHAPTVVDVTGADRTVVLDGNWIVRAQEPASGTRTSAKTRIVLRVGKPTDFAASAPAITGVVPNVLCRDLQSAQDTLQDAGFVVLASLDGTGKGRRQLIDRNWVVVGQSRAAGTRPARTTKITLVVVKFGEPNERCPT